MKTGDKRTFPLSIPELGINNNVDFIFVEGIGWVADRNIKMRISYDQLERCGLVMGLGCNAGDEVFTCRILRCTEWDDCMDYDDSDSVWNWSGCYSWVRSLEYERANCLYRVLRGYSASSYLTHTYPTSSYASSGFRPVLEVLQSETLPSDINQLSSNLSLAVKRITKPGDAERRPLRAAVC
jgi:hypothetical protein